MRDRLEIIRNVLSEDGTLWIRIDENEAHYLNVMCDEIFGRRNFISNVVWQNIYSRSNDTCLSLSHNSIFVY
jgi:adenine-specific DNA-methyltransferase